MYIVQIETRKQCVSSITEGLNWPLHLQRPFSLQLTVAYPDNERPVGNISAGLSVRLTARAEQSACDMGKV